MAENKCGSCSGCCVVFAIPQLNKARDEPCAYLAEEGGCSIYHGDRPSVCRKFRCFWHLSGAPERLRPDNLGLLIRRFPFRLHGRTDAAVYVAHRMPETSRITEQGLRFLTALTLSETEAAAVVYRSYDADGVVQDQLRYQDGRFSDLEIHEIKLQFVHE